MKFVALISGGKDSNYNILHCLKQGHELIAFANLHPENEDEQELDSFMFQTVGHDLIRWYPECSGVPLYRQALHKNGSKNIALNYTETKDDEIEDLYKLLRKIQLDSPDLEAVSVGAILSSYQRTRVEDVCSRLGLTTLSYLWQRDQRELMQEMCSMSKDTIVTTDDCDNVGKLDARIIKVAAIGLNQNHLGKSLPEILPTMLKLNSLYDVHICGEGGEFETMVLDTPFFKHGHLQLNSINDVTDTSNDGVFAATFNVEYVPEALSPTKLEKELEKLPVPAVLNEKWYEMYLRLMTIDLKKLNNCPNHHNVSPSVPVSINEVGKLLYISNIAPSKGESLKEKCLDVFSQLTSILSSRSIFACQILSSSLLLSDMNNFQEVNSYYNEYFNVTKIGPLPPARACVESSFLKHPVQLSVVVDLSADCVPTDNGIILNRSKDGLHVQGRSYWCPCNIGPYSQATWNQSDRNKVTYISGQIGLEPSSMKLWGDTTLLENPDIAEVVLSLRNYFTLSETVNSSIPLIMVCYISQSYVLPAVRSAWSLFAKELAEESELWFDQEPVGVDSLVIVKVSNLPKNALCEWTGMNCQNLAIEDDYDEDDLAAQIHMNLTLKSQTDIELPNYAHDVIISENGFKRHFITLFLDSHEQLILTLSECKNAQITLFFSKDYAVPEYTHVEYIPVEQVYDKSSPRAYGLVIKY